MSTLIIISSAAVLVAIVGCLTIWRLDRARAEEVAHDGGRLVRDPA